MAIQTNPHVSAVHACNFSREIARANTLQALEAAAIKHSPYLIGDDKARLRDEYAARVVAIKGLKK